MFQLRTLPLKINNTEKEYQKDADPYKHTLYPYKTAIDSLNELYSPCRPKLNNFTFLSTANPSCVTYSTSQSVKPAIDESLQPRPCYKTKAIESQYNNLISYNESHEENHFSIINDNLRSLINKKKPRKTETTIVSNSNSTFEKKLTQEVPILKVKTCLNTILHPSLKQPTEETININDWIDPDDSLKTNISTNSEPVISPDPQKHIIPEKFRNKKLPHLDKRIKTGYLKFFDEKNHFGFMTLTTEPFGEVFVFGNEFDKANIDPGVLSVASNNPGIVFRFRVMYYMGKHGESKKAVNIRF